MPHQQPMHQLCGCGIPGLGLSRAKNSLQHGQDNARLHDENWAWACSRALACLWAPQAVGRIPNSDPWGDLKRRIRGEDKQPEKRRKRRKGKRKRKLTGFPRLQSRPGVSYPFPLAVHTEIQDSCLPSRAKQSRVSFLVENWGKEMWVGIFFL